MQAALTSTAQAFQIKYHRGKRSVYCDHCKSPASNSIVSHLKKKHPQVWRSYVKTFAELREQGYSYKKIMWHFGRAFSWTVIERALVEEGIPPAPAKRRKDLPLQPRSFREESTTLWSFENRGSWAVHDAVYRGNWAPEVPRNLILRYSKRGDWVLDPFIGGGTTAIECALLGRKSIGYDISPGAIALTRNKVRALKRRALKEKKGAYARRVRDSVVRVLLGDARAMKRVPDSSVQLVCAHPPYLNIIGYTRRNPADLSTISDVDRYIREMRKIALEVFRCLKPGGTFCVLIGDVRRNGTVIPLGLRVLNALLDTFDLQEIILKKQNRCQTTPFWKNHRFLQIQHEYLFVLRKQHPQELAED